MLKGVRVLGEIPDRVTFTFPLLVEEGRTGFRIAGRDPRDFAAATRRVLDSPLLADELGRNAAESAASYTWTTMAARLRRVYQDLNVRERVDCLA
ncbi:MAG: hypothetical protein AAF548_11100 [Actinomycetota bacterium]